MGDTYYDEDGQPLGEVHQAEDGNYVIVGYDGQIVAAASPDGTPLDPGGYEADIAPDYVTRDEFDQQAELQQRLAALEARAQQLPQHAQPVPPHDPQRDMAILETNFEQVAQRAGRELTTKEVESVLAKMSDQLDAGRTPDFDAAVAEMDFRPIHEMKREDIVAWGAQRLHEAQNDGAAGPQPKHETYDLDVPEQRHAFMNDRLTGALSDEEAQARIAQPEPEAA